MTFADLLAAKDAAVKRKEQTAFELADAEAMLKEATEADLEAGHAKTAAHKAIRDILGERGERCTVDDDGTVTIYRAVEPENEDDPGWRSYHPITEATLKGETK